MVHTTQRARDKYGQIDKGPRNPEAVQLLRVLQAVHILKKPLPEGWDWAFKWLKEVGDRRSSHKWEAQGVPVAEVKALYTELLALGGPCVDVQATEDPTGAAGADSDVVFVYDAGSEVVNGEYRHAYDDVVGNPHYELVTDPNIVLQQESNSLGDIRWIIEQTDEDGNSKVFYRTNYKYGWSTDLPFPPEDRQEWHVYDGERPAPKLGCPASGLSSGGALQL